MGTLKLSPDVAGGYDDKGQNVKLNDLLFFALDHAVNSVKVSTPLVPIRCDGVSRQAETHEICVFGNLAAESPASSKICV